MLAQNLFNKKNINDPFINKNVNVFVKPAYLPIHRVNQPFLLYLKWNEQVGKFVDMLYRGYSTQIVNKNVFCGPTVYIVATSK